jgi:hypothetical protein
MERFSRSSPYSGEDKKLKIVNSGIVDDPRVIIDAYGGATNDQQDDLNLRLLDSENSSPHLMDDREEQNRAFVHRYRTQNGCSRICQNFGLMCCRHNLRSQKSICDLQTRIYE